MSWLRALLGGGQGEDSEIRKRIQEARLDKYKSLKRYAHLEGDEELYEFASRKESLMLQMLDDEYDVIALGVKAGPRDDEQ